ncbi:ribulose-phosphate 3-epimerase [Lacticaseibacillus salsurivasis]|uniref:ribulose-phosphate 3-epimerase n=1 Tax=Lacticaseibacillus salsurivasis TaxID=3081441 RepID=UPI0030C6CEA5
MKEIIPSLIDLPPDKTMSTFEALRQRGIHKVHIDVMDSRFVPRFGFNDRYVSWIHEFAKFVSDVHLMVDNPEKVIPDFINAGAERITVHLNSFNDPYYLMTYLAENKVEPGIAINPSEPPEEIKELAPLVKRVLVMTCSPGRKSKGVLPGMEEKVQFLSDYRRDRGLKYKIEVDGSITADNIAKFAKVGCDEFVSGRYIVGSVDPGGRVEELQRIVSNFDE